MKVIQHIASRSARGRNLTICYGVHKFPAGELMVALTSEGICWTGINCSLAKFRANWKSAELIEDAGVTAAAAREIARLWPKRLDKLSIPIVLYGTAFQLKVWKELLKIKCGATVTYADIARKIGKPKAARAVGSAVGKNTVSIIVPCHRVVNKDESRSNYGWGPEVKKALLRDEARA